MYGYFAGVDRSKGQAEFRRLTDKAVVIAEKIQCTETSVSRYRNGKSRPDERTRNLIFEHYPHIAPKLWDLPENTGAYTVGAADLLEQAPPADTLPDLEDDSPAALAKRLLGHARILENGFRVAVAGNDPDAPAQLKALTAIAKDLANISGTNITVRTILDSNAWRKIDEKMRHGLSKLDNADEAIAVLLDCLGDGE